VAPTRGTSLIDIEGGPMWDHEADMALVETLEAELRPVISVERAEMAVNDAEFGQLVAHRFIELAGAKAGAADRQGAES
jgi:uncharacterized protein (UPF0261 family)